VYQWNSENNQRQLLNQIPFLTAEQADPGPPVQSPVQNCKFVTSLNPATGYSNPNTGLPNTYWYGDAVVMKKNAGTYNPCASVPPVTPPNHSAHYVSWVNSTNQNPGFWSFSKPTPYSSDIVFEFCSCSNSQGCARLGAPTCQ